eukprot:7684985-Lingulodinium_polyedra.AAC.1
MRFPAPAVVHDPRGRGNGQQPPVFERVPTQFLRGLRPPRDTRASSEGPRVSARTWARRVPWSWCWKPATSG